VYVNRRKEHPYQKEEILKGAWKLKKILDWIGEGVCILAGVGKVKRVFVLLFA
jgi:hypothetical protein